MVKISKNTNLLITIILFTLTLILWLKTLIDFFSYQFPINSLLIFSMWFGFLIYFFLYIRILYLVVKKIESDFNTEKCNWMWIFIPLSVICTSPVCYSNTIFIAPYTMSTVIRLIGLSFSFIIFFNKKLNQDLRIFLITLLGFFSLIPNDRCENMFNYSWIDLLGASPLTYLPTAITIIFYSFYSYNYLTKKQAFIILSLVSFGSLMLAVGHRIHFLW